MEPRIFRHGAVDSTSERAFAELAAGRARHGDVHVAQAQSRGRGRLGRTWHSPHGEGLYLSVVLRPEHAWPAPALTMALGLAALDAVRALGLARATLDWPNDVVARGAKLAGVLVETRDLDARRPAYVAGIGVNVGQREFPAELRAERAVTSLALAGVAATVAATERALLAELERWIAELERDPSAVERAYVRAAGLDRGRVRVETARGVWEGSLEAWSSADGVVLRSAPGILERIALEHVRACSRIQDRAADRPARSERSSR